MRKHDHECVPQRFGPVDLLSVLAKSDHGVHQYKRRLFDGRSDANPNPDAVPDGHPNPSGDTNACADTIPDGYARADAVPDPEYMRERARRISKRGDRHLAEARRLSDDASGGDPTFDPTQDPQEGP